MRAVREWGGTKARTEKTAPTEGDTEQWLSTGVNQKIALSNNRRPTSREERVCPWRIGVVDTQCSINPCANPARAVSSSRAERKGPGEWFSGPGATSMGEKLEGMGDVGGQHRSWLKHSCWRMVL